MAEARSVVVRLTAETAQYIASMQAAGKMTADAMTKAQSATAAQSQAMDQLGGTAGKIGLAAAVGLGAVVATTANFEQAMSAVQAATHETTSNMDLLREAAIQAGADTAFSATEAAAGIENLAKAGVATVDILDGGLAGALDLAAAGSLDVAQAAEIAATTMTQFNLAGSDVTHIADVLAAGAGKAQGEVTDMADALRYVGPVAAQMGISLEETGGAIAYLASQGILGEQAGTSLRGMLTALTSPSKVAQEQMDALGISMYDAQGQFIGLDGLAGQLQSSLSGLGEAERDAALGRIFGNAQITAARILYAGGAEAVAEWTAQVNDSGFAAETANIKLDNLRGDLEALGGALESALIGAGGESQGILRDLTQNATAMVNAFNDAPDAVQGTVTKLLALTAITGGAAWFGSRVIQGINNTRQALDDLELSATRSGRALKGLATVGTAATAVLLVNDAIAQIVRSTDEAAPAVQGLTRDLLNMDSAVQMQQLVDGLGDLRGSLDLLADPSLLQDIGSVYDKIPFGLGTAFADYVPGLGNVRQEAREAASSIQALDEALAGIVNQGSPRQAREVFDQLAASYQLTDVEQQQLLDRLPGFRDALDGAANSAQLAGDAAEGMGRKAGGAAPALAALAEALEKSREDAGKTAREFFNLGAGLDDAKTSLGEWIQQMESQASALRNFRLNAERAAENGLRRGLIAALQEAGPAGALRMRQLANATEAEIRRANRAWSRGQREIARYTDAVGGVKPAELAVNEEQAEAALRRVQRLLDKFGLTRAEATALLDDAASGRIKTVQQLINKYGLTRAEAQALLDASQALGGISNVKGALANLDGDRAVVTIETRRIYTTIENAIPGLPEWPKKAAGGLIVGPGGGRDDRVPVLASNREYVMPAVAVEHYGVGFMEAVRARRLADGGAVAGEAVRATQSAVRTTVAGGGRVVTERVVERLPRSLTLQVDGQQFTAYVSDVARSEYDADRRFDRVRAGR